MQRSDRDTFNGWSSNGRTTHMHSPPSLALPARVVIVVVGSRVLGAARLLGLGRAILVARHRSRLLERLEEGRLRVLEGLEIGFCNVSGFGSVGWAD